MTRCATSRDVQTGAEWRDIRAAVDYSFYHTVIRIVSRKEASMVLAPIEF